jgi:hypothetical protein
VLADHHGLQPVENCVRAWVISGTSWWTACKIVYEAGADVMANRAMNDVIRKLRGVALMHDSGELTDGQLLEQFLTMRAEVAFSAVVLLWALR